MIFLQDLGVNPKEFFPNGILSPEVLGALFFLFIALIFVALVVYIYISFAYMAIGKKVKYKYPGIAWVPIVGPALILSRTAKMHWWPTLLVIGFFIPIVSFLFAITYMVYYTIWSWKTFEKIKKPGWWSLLLWIPIVNLVILGIVAWSK